MPTAVQSNPYGPGGPTAGQPVPPQGNLTPADIQAIVTELTPLQSRFRQASTFLKSDLSQASFTLAAPTVPVNGSSVGLAVRLITEWNFVITVVNGVSSAEVFTFSPLFPWNLVQNTQVSINGGAATFSAGGLATLASMLRTRKGTLIPSTSGGFGLAISPALCTLTLGSNLTATNATVATPKLGGIASISVAGSASTLNTITGRFYTVERLVLDKDSLLGALPLQNQSTNVQITRRIVSALSGTRNDLSMPFYTAGADLTFTLTSMTADTTYEFASVPADPSLYSAMVRNSFQIIEQSALTTAAVGAQSLKYNIPTNLYLLALHLLTVDTNGAVLPAFNATTGLGDLAVAYNAQTVTPVKLHANRQRADQFLSYGHDVGYIFPGWRLWDGEDTSDDITASDNMGWLDSYSAANPQLLFDVGATAGVTLTSNVVREAVVAGAVTQVGG